MALSWHMESCTLPRFEGGKSYPFAHSVCYANGFTKIHRHTCEVLQVLQNVIRRNLGKVLPVVLCSDLSEQMFCLQGLENYGFGVLAKGTTSPLTITIFDDESPVMVLWDAKNMFGKDWQKAFGIAGHEHHGCIDLALKRTPETPLTDNEKAYMRSRAKGLWACARDLLRRNALICQSMLGRSVVTFTSVLRQSRKRSVGTLRGLGAKRTVAQMWHLQNRNERPKSDDELYTYQACTRGGLAFVGAEHASRPYDLGNSGFVVAAFDATSQYPAQMVSHRFPERFRPATQRNLALDVEIVLGVELTDVLANFEQPFLVAFDGCFEFENLRIKPDTVFAENGIATLQWSRLNERMFEGAGDLQFSAMATNKLRFLGYKDSADEPEHLFGKLTSAKKAQLWLTEIELWSLAQVYEWDTITALCGYDTMSFCKPTDMTVLSVMELYKRKQSLKESGGIEYENTKRALNSLYGIEATNEARPEQTFGYHGIELGRLRGIEDLPTTSKAWYQMGQRMSAWGRLAQVVNMILAAPYAQGIICGDTDSLKILVHETLLDDLGKALNQWGDALTLGKMSICQRCETQYPSAFDTLDGIGYYRLEYVTDKFCAGWNKAYIYEDPHGMHVTLAGVKTATEQVFEEADNSYTALANELRQRHSFGKVCNLLLGYNVSIEHAITKAQVFEYPAFGSRFEGRVTDYLGNTNDICEPLTVARHPLGITLGNTFDPDTFADMEKARQNNPEVCTEEVMITWEPGQEPQLWSYTVEGMKNEIL